ncbi:MAG: sensor histidine kinase KdpD [Dokdonella sp.]
MPVPASEQRPDPDALLARVQSEQLRANRGRLKIFLGASAGVGKSYAMLEAARREAAAGVDIVVGYVELHGRRETEALLEGLEILARQSFEHRGVNLTEFDLDAALGRRPQVLLVDELAHSNHVGARHPQRWMDIEELLDAGIDVYTTVNIQHLESLNDVVAQITGVRVRETVPDHVFDSADEVELVDLPPDDLLERLREGKVYVPERARQASEGFFRKGNLIALRQLALRATADRVDAAMREYRDAHAIRKNWPSGERLLVCIGPDALSTRLVRTARRIASALHAQWFAVYVETPALTRLPQAARDRVLRSLKLADRLGAETANLGGESVAAELLAFAAQRNVGRIIVGKPLRNRWYDRLRSSLVDQVIRESGAIDVYVITAEGDDSSPQSPRRVPRSSRWPAYIKGIAVILFTTLACLALRHQLQPTNLVMLYLLGTVLVAMRFGRGPSTVAAVLSVGLFDFLFVPPYLSFAVSDTEYVITFGGMLATAFIISSLMARGRRQTTVARHRERRASELYSISRELSRARDLTELAAILRQHVLVAFDGEATVLFPDADGRIQDPESFCDRGLSTRNQVRYPVPGNDLGIAQWSYDHRQPAGMTTDTLASADAIFLPLNAPPRCISVLGLRPRERRQLDIPEQMQLLDAMVNQTALAMERVQLAESAHTAGLQAESERLRNVLLSAISHDFRTPLASIIGAASTLRDSAPGRLGTAQQEGLLDLLLGEARRMNRLIGNLLELTRLNSGNFSLKRAWLPPEEIIGAVLTRLRGALADRKLAVDVARDLPLVPCDEVMIEQVLTNLIENAIRHTPTTTPIDIRARAEAGSLVVSVRDHGPGLAANEETRVFEKFHRARVEGAQGGFGLGLTICKAIIEAHGGTITAQNATDGGAEFRFSLPLSVPEMRAA